MEDFKTTAKMQCFKEGGSVQRKVDGYQKRERKDVMSEDIAKDKSMVKKGVKQHEANLHKGEPKTELTFKKGGRAKKEGGCVGRYKTGGTVENAYGTPKTKKDVKDIANTKRQKPKKMQMGGMTAPAPAGVAAAAPSGAMGQGAISELEKRRMMEKMKRARMLDPAQQSDLIKQSPAAAGLVPPPVGQYKKGGKACK
jgi:hypothetical protein